MKTDTDSVLVALVKSGWNYRLSNVCGFRGPLKRRFVGKWYRWVFIFIALFFDAILVTNLLTLGIKFVDADVPLSERCTCGFPLMTLSMALFRSVFIAFYKSRLRNLMTEYESCFDDDPYPEHLLKEIDKGAKMIQPMALSLIIFMSTPMAPMAMSPILDHLYGSPDRVPKDFVVPAWYPFETTSGSAFHFLALVIQGLGAFSVTLRVVSYDDLFNSYALRQVALFRHLQHNLGKIFETIHVDDNGKVHFTDFSGTSITRDQLSHQIVSRLRTWVIHHQKSLRLMKELQGIFSFPIAVQFFFISMCLCMDALVVAKSSIDTFEITCCVMYVMGNSMALLFACRIGDHFVLESKVLTDQIIGKNFNMLTPKEYKYLRMILTICQKPKSLTALGVFPLSTETFQSILASTYSFFTVLKKIG